MSTRNGAAPADDAAGRQNLTQIVSYARTMAGARYRGDDRAALVAHVAEKYRLPDDEAARVVAEAERSPRGEPLRNTDVGNASRLAQFYGDRIRYLYAEKRWLAWDGTRWAPDATGAVERFAKDTARRLVTEANEIKDDDRRRAAIRWALQSESAPKLEAMMKLARSDQRIVVRAEELDSDPWALNVANGTLDLRTGELRAHDPGEMHSKVAAAAYHSEAPRARWEAFLEQVLPDPEVRRYVQKLAGYSLTGEVGENVLPFPYGSGANGKSVFLGVLREALGDYATEAAPDLLVQRRERGIPVDVYDLRGYRFVTTTEVEGGRGMATDVMKRLTGETRLKARGMRQNFESFRNVTKLWMAANDRPPVDGLDEAIWRRVRLIPFTVTIPAEQRDPLLMQKLLEQREGILVWAVEGCLAYLDEGLKPPAAVEAATEDYREESNPLREWADAECELDEDAVTPASQLRDSYEKYCQVTRARPIRKGTKWKAALEALGASQPGTDGRAFVERRQVRAWQGIRLAEPEHRGLAM